MGSRLAQSQMVTKAKNGYILPRSCLANPDINRLINSDEIQSVVKVPKNDHKLKHAPLKKNPLLNKGTMLKLNPYPTSRAEENRKIRKRVRDNKTAKAFYRQLIADSDYQNEGCEGYRAWLGLNKT